MRVLKDKAGFMNSTFLVIAPVLLSLVIGPEPSSAQASIDAVDSIEAFVARLPPGDSVFVNHSPNYPPLDIPSIVAATDLAVEGEVVSSFNREAKGPHYVTTTYVVRVDNVLMGRAQLPLAAASDTTTVSVTRIGGRISYYGREIITTDHSLGPFEVGARLYLFLKKSDNVGPGEFAIVGGPFGVFRKVDGKVEPLAKTNVELRDKYSGLDEASFRAYVLDTVGAAR